MDTVIKRWYDLISIDSVDGHEINAANYVAEVLRGMGIEPHYKVISPMIKNASVHPFGANSIAENREKPCC